MKLYGLYKTEYLGALTCRGGYEIQTVLKALATSRKHAPVSLFRQSSSLFFQRDCLSLNPNLSTRITPRSLISCDVLANRVF